MDDTVSCNYHVTIAAAFEMQMVLNKAARVLHRYSTYRAADAAL